MGSLSFSEIVVIVLVILIVFGPNRLPDLARKAGEFMNKVRNASSSMTDALGVDYEQTVEPFLSAKQDFDAVKADITRTVTTFGQPAAIPDDSAEDESPDQESADPVAEVDPDAVDTGRNTVADPAEPTLPDEADTSDDSTAAT